MTDNIVVPVLFINTEVCRGIDDAAKKINRGQQQVAQAILAAGQQQESGSNIGLGIGLGLLGGRSAGGLITAGGRGARGLMASGGPRALSTQELQNVANGIRRTANITGFNTVAGRNIQLFGTGNRNLRQIARSRSSTTSRRSVEAGTVRIDPETGDIVELSEEFLGPLPSANPVQRAVDQNVQQVVNQRYNRAMDAGRP